MNVLLVLFLFLVYPFLYPMWKLGHLHNRGRSLRLLAELEMQPPSPRQRCQINASMPLLALYFDGHSDLRVDFRLSRESFNALMAVPSTECDHGWGPEISCLVFLYWLASATSYRVVARARAHDIHSIQLQAICDDQCKFLDVFVGYTGSVHDARVLRNSPIYYEQSYPPPGYCILGDGGYPCLQ